MIKEKIIVFHPMQQHSYQTAIGLKKSNKLYGYWTSIYYKPERLLYKLLNKVLPAGEKERMLGRSHNYLNDSVVCFCSFYGLMFLLISRLDKTKNKYFKFKSKDILIRKIGKKVAKRAIKENIDYIITYDTWSYGLISELKKRKSKIKLIMDCSSLYSEEIRKIMEKDISINKYNSDAYRSIMEQFSLKYLKKFQYEKDNCNFFLSPSSVVDNSFIKYGVNKDNIFRCTYGSYFKHKKYIEKKKDIITFIYIGRLSYAKGVHYLINAFEKIERNDFQLLLVGADVDNIVKTITNNNIKAIGVVSHNKISDLLEHADVIISASLYDGFSLALLEGAAYNLPILCTTSNGAADYVQNGINGYKFQSFDSDIIIEKVTYLLEHKNKLSYLSKNAGDIINNLTWDNYYKNISICLNNIIKKGE